MTLGLESPHAGQELAILEPRVDASLRNNTKVVENLMRYASPSVATGVAVFGLGVAALPLISSCRPERDDSVDEAAELFTAEELRVRIGPLAPARLSAEMQLEVLDVVQHASVASQDDLKAEVEALQAWSDVTAPALSSLERRSALAYLGLGLDAEPEAVHRSYKQKALAVHPDKGGSEEDFLNLQEMVGRLQEADVKSEEKGKTGNLYETMREMMKRAKEAREQKETCQEQHVPEEIRLQHRRTALHEQTIRFWERAKTAELQLNEGYGTKSQNASILAQLHHLVDDLATGIKSLPQGIAAATAGERLLCRLLRRGVDILAASSLVDATATVAHVSLSFVGPLLETVRDCGPCPRLELRCRLLLRALAEVPAAFENFMKTVDEGFLRGFDNHRYSGHVWDEYLLAWYWAMTTLTTTGYGDITPSSPGEILFCVLAMVIGGFFYGYVVGTIASMVANADLNKSAFYDRMEFVHAWLAHHSLPNEMRRRLRRYFKALMERRSAADETELWCELTQELQMEVGDYIVTETVKANPLFDRLGNGAIVQLQSVLRHVTMEPGQRVATAGEVGTAMFMIEEGVLKWNRAGEEKTTLLGPGESFGEEILLGFKEDYEYTVIVMQRSKLEVIEESDFLHVFQCMPRVMDRMRRNALQLNPEWDETGAKTSDATTKIVPVRVFKGR